MNITKLKQFYKDKLKQLQDNLEFVRERAEMEKDPVNSEWKKMEYQIENIIELNQYDYQQIELGNYVDPKM